jgi:hypothetical protein
MVIVAGKTVEFQGIRFFDGLRPDIVKYISVFPV